jgi:hypothetical protein
VVVDGSAEVFEVPAQVPHHSLVEGSEVGRGVAKGVSAQEVMEVPVDLWRPDKLMTSGQLN